MNDTPEKGTAPLNFGGSSPFTSGQTEPLTDVTPEVAEAAPEAVATEAVSEAPQDPTEAPADQGEQPVTATTETQTAPVAEADASFAEQVGEVIVPAIEQEESTPVVPADASTTPAEELAPTAEIPATPQTELEADVAKELNAHAGNPAEPADIPVIAATNDAEIERQIAARDELNAKIEENQKAQRVDVLAQIKRVVETYKIPLAEVGEYLGIKGTRKGTKAKPKYRNPADGKEWSGRGKEPLWIKGKNREEFLITT